jgi:hypothetical protein
MEEEQVDLVAAAAVRLEETGRRQPTRGKSNAAG